MIRVLKIASLVSVVVLLNAVTTLLFVQSAAPASAGPNCVNGDVNGDAALDITDPIYLLTHMFDGGPEPVACAQSPAEVIVINTPSVSVADLPTVQVQGFFNPDNSIHIVAGVETGPVPTQIFEVPTGFRLYLNGIHLDPDSSGSGVALSSRAVTSLRLFDTNATDLRFVTGFTWWTNLNASPVHYSHELSAPIMFDSGSIVHAGIRVTGGSNENTQGFSTSRFTFSGYLEPSN